MKKLMVLGLLVAGLVQANLSLADESDWSPVAQSSDIDFAGRNSSFAISGNTLTYLERIKNHVQNQTSYDYVSTTIQACQQGMGILRTTSFAGYALSAIDVVQGETNIASEEFTLLCDLYKTHPRGH